MNLRIEASCIVRSPLALLVLVIVLVLVIAISEVEHEHDYEHDYDAGPEHLNTASPLPHLEVVLLIAQEGLDVGDLAVVVGQVHHR